jgi:hypothetical protein
MNLQYRLVWTSIRANSERTLAGSPTTREDALAKFDDCEAIRESASAGRGRLRVMADSEYRRILAGAR